MDDLTERLRRHYAAQQLPSARVQEILALGRAAGGAGTRLAWWRIAAAAVFLGLGILGTSYFLGAGAPRTIAVQSLAGRVAAWLANPAHKLPVRSADRRVLEEWLRQRGGPASLQLPPAMDELSTVGCQVLEVQGQKVHILCFSLDVPPRDSPPGAAPAKKTPSTVGSVAHLVVAPRAMFSVPPRPGAPVVLPLAGAWNFAAWSRGDQVYVVAAPLPVAQLAALVAPQRSAGRPGTVRAIAQAMVFPPAPGALLVTGSDTLALKP